MGFLRQMLSLLGTLLVGRNQAASPATSTDELEHAALSQLLEIYSNNSATSITLTDENSIVSATVISSQGGVGDSIKVDVEGTVVSVDVPVVVIDKYGGQLVLVIGIYPWKHVFGDDEVLDDEGDVVDIRSNPVSVRLARMSWEGGDWVGVFFSVENLEEPIAISVPTKNITDVTWDCGFFNETADIWMLNNIELAQKRENYLVCTTTHLTMFGAIGESFVQALRCSNARLLSAAGLRQLGRGTWAFEVPAVIFWCICALHLGLAAVAVRFDLRAREEHLWTDTDFLRECGPIGERDEDDNKDPGATAGLSKKLADAVREKRNAFRNKWGCGVDLRAQVDAFCIRYKVAHRIWLAPGDIEFALKSLVHERPFPNPAVSEAAPLSPNILQRRPSDWISPSVDQPPSQEDTERTSPRRRFETSAASTQPLDVTSADPDLTKSYSDITVFKSLAVPSLRRRSTHMPWSNAATHRRSWHEPVMKSLAKPVSHEIEIELEEYYAQHSSRRYSAAVLCFALQPWLSLYRYSIYDSCRVRTLHLTVEVFGALLFSAFFFGIDAPAVDTPVDCDSDGGWAAELWSEIAAGVLGFFFGLIPIFILKLLSRREFMELEDTAAIQQQLLQWRLQDAAMWVIGLAYITFCFVFTIVFLANTKRDSGLSFVAATAVEESILNLLVPILIALAYAVAELSTHRHEEDYTKVKELLGLTATQCLSPTLGQVVGKPVQDVNET